MSHMSFSTHLARISDGAKFGKHLVLISAISLGAFTGAQAHPLDSPETVYIDGVPCNGACQSYMAWSRKTLQENSASARAPAQAAAPKAGRARMTSMASLKRAPVSPARQTVPLPRKSPRDLTA